MYGLGFAKSRRGSWKPAPRRDDVRPWQNARRPGLDLDGNRRLLADIVEARFSAIVAAEIKRFQARIADGEIVQADRLSFEPAEVFLKQREIVGERFVAMDMSPGPALERPGSEASDISADIEDHG